MSVSGDLYQQVILEHNKRPRNYRKLEEVSHIADGHNPLCGDHLIVYLSVNEDQLIQDVTFQGDGCAISRASASMMTESLKGKSIEDARNVFSEFIALVKGEVNPDVDDHSLGKLAIFSGIWKYPSRVKCAALSWHAAIGALEAKKTVSTE